MIRLFRILGVLIAAAFMTVAPLASVYGDGAAQAQSSMRFRGGARGVLTIVPSGANTFYVVAPNPQGGAIAFRMQRGVGVAADSGNLGLSYPEFRLTGVFELSSVTSDPTAPIGSWINDTGANGYAINVGGKLGGEYHGIGTGSLNSEVFTADGVTINPTAGIAYANSFTSSTNVTIDWTGGNTATIAHTLTVNADATLSEAWPSITSTGAAATDAYIGMAILTGPGPFEAAFGPSNLGFAVTDGRYQLGTPGEVTLRDASTGKTLRSISNAPTAGSYSLTRVLGQYAFNREKLYYALPAGVLGPRSWYVRSMSFGKGAAGATTFGANMVTNGDASSGVISPWVSGIGTTTVVAGKFQQVQAATENRLYEAVAGHTIGASYLMVANSDSGDPALGRLTVGINNNSTTGALFTNSTVVDDNGQVYVATQATHYPMLRTATGTAGPVINWDDVTIRLLSTVSW